jgi:hypothetical protein
MIPDDPPSAYQSRKDMLAGDVFVPVVARFRSGWDTLSWLFEISRDQRKPPTTT